MLSVPPKYTAYQGFDALFHDVEAYVSNGVDLMKSDMYAITAIKILRSRNLAKAVKDGKDMEAQRKGCVWQHACRDG